jgi:hypothetical protein
MEGTLCSPLGTLTRRNREPPSLELFMCEGKASFADLLQAGFPRGKIMTIEFSKKAQEGI